MNRMKRVGVLSAALALAGGAWADHTVVISGNSNHVYTVSDDGMTWTQGNKFNGSFQGAVLPGDGYLYYRSGNAINKYDATGTLKSKFVDAPTPEQLCMSADKVWIYSGSLANSGNVMNVWRYRISNPSIGGQYISATVAGSAGPQVRQMACGYDGYLYLASRTLQGAYVYDVTLPTPECVDTYKVNNCQGGIVIDEKLGKLNILGEARVLQFDLGDSSKYNAIYNIPNFANPFSSCKIGDLCFGGGWTQGGVVKIGNNSATPVSIDKRIIGLQGMLCLDDVNTGTKLPNITGVWYMNGGSGSSCNGANPGVFDLSCFGGARGNVDGVIRGGLYLGSSAYGTFADSAAMFPSTGDFTFTTWAAFPNNSTSQVRALLSNGTATFGLDANGKLGFFVGETSIVGTSVVNDGKWHFLSVIRTAGNIQIWVDGVKETESAFDATTAIASSTLWTLGAKPNNTAKLGKAWFDEIRVYPVALPASDIAYLINIGAKNGIAQLATPTEPETQQYSDAEAVKLGTVVDHEFSGDANVGATSMALVDNILYMSRDLGVAAGNLGAGSALYKSENNGSTWTKMLTCEYAQMSLFASGNTLFALALNSEKKLCLGTLNNGEFSWAASDFANSSMRACQPIVKDNRVWIGYHPSDVALGFGVLSAAFDGSAISDIKAMSSTNSFSQSGGTFLFYKNYLAGVPVIGTNNYVTVISPVEMKISSDAWSTAPEVAHHTIATSSTSAQYCVPIRFPGGAKPFAIVRDPQGGRYWAVTMPQHEVDVANNVLPQSVQSKMALYSSPDLVEWRFHGDIADSGDVVNTGMKHPSLAIVGDDLLVSFAARVDDGTGAALTSNDSNFLLMKKVADFRDKYHDDPSWPKDHKYLLAIHNGGSVAYNDGGTCVMKYYRDKTTGDWLPGGIIIYNCGGQAIRVYGDRIYIGYWGGNVKVFSTDGTLLKTVKVCPTAVDGMAISNDGRYVYCSNQNSGAGDIYMLDTNDWSTKLLVSDDTLKFPRSLAMNSDGTLFAAGREGKTLKRIYLKNDGTFDHSEVVHSGSGYQTLCFSNDESLLFIGFSGSNVGEWKFSTSEMETTKLNYDIFDMAAYGDLLFASTFGNNNSRPGGLSIIRQGSDAYKVRYIVPMPTGGGSRIAVMDVPKPGLMILFK